MSPRRARFAVIGDLTLDVTVAPSRPSRPGGDVPAVVRLGPGGQGANVAVRLARRGSAVTLLAAVGRDAAGSILRESLDADGVELCGREASRSGVVVAMLDASGERSMLSDRQALDPEPLADLLPSVTWAHCSGYALLDEAVGERVAVLLGARPAATRLSVGGGSVPPEPGPVRRLRARLETARPDLLILSRDEARSLASRLPTLAELARALADVATLVVVTGGVDGSAGVIGDEAIEVDATPLPDPVVDTTGAGDAFAAALIASLAASRWPPDAASLRAGMAEGAVLGAHVARAMGAQARVAPEGGA